MVTEVCFKELLKRIGPRIAGGTAIKWTSHDRTKYNNYVMMVGKIHPTYFALTRVGGYYDTTYFEQIYEREKLISISLDRKVTGTQLRIETLW